MTKDNQNSKKAPGIINRKPPVSKKLKAMDLVKEMTAKGMLKDEPEAFDTQLEEVMKWDDDALDSMWRVIAEQKTWRKLSDREPKSELQVELETVITDGLNEFCNQPIPVVGMLEEPERSLKFMDPIEDFSVPPAYENPAVIEQGSFETWDCNKVTFTKRDPVIPEHGPQLIDNQFFGMLEDEDICAHGIGVCANGFCSFCGADTLATQQPYIAAKKETPDEIVKKVKARLQENNRATNNGYGQDKYPNQINVKLTDDDMKRADAIKQDLCMEDMSGSQLMRMFIRQGMKYYENNK